jgi:hypothetical protein
LATAEPINEKAAKEFGLVGCMLHMLFQDRVSAHVEAKSSSRNASPPNGHPDRPHFAFEQANSGRDAGIAPFLCAPIPKPNPARRLLIP